MRRIHRWGHREWLLWAFLVAPVLLGPLHGQERRWPCEKGINIQRDKSGKPVWLGVDELEKRAIRKVQIKLPCCPKGFHSVVVDALIDAKGNVRCVRANDVPPLIRLNAIDAAEQWTFKPQLVDNKPVATYGRLRLTFSVD